MRTADAQFSIATDVLDIVLSGFGSTYMTYVEPFVGGCSTFRQVPIYDGTRVIGFDKNNFLIALLNYGKLHLNQEDPLKYHINTDVYNEFLGRDIPKEEYVYLREMARKSPEERVAANVSDALIGYAGFIFSFGMDFFGGYTKMCNATIARVKGYIKTVEMLREKELYVLDYMELSNILPSEPVIIYADPPHVGTSYVGKFFKYGWLDVKRPEFENIVIGWHKQGHKVYVAEYLMNNSFKEVWSSRSFVDLRDEIEDKKAHKKTAKKVEKIYVPM